MPPPSCAAPGRCWARRADAGVAAMGAKIGIIGTGGVGESVALSLLHFGTAGELVLNDVR